MHRHSGLFMCAGICTCAQAYVGCKCAQEWACEVVRVCIRQLHLCGHVWVIHVYRNTLMYAYGL